MVSIMTTRNVGRRIAATRGGGISEQDGREDKRDGLETDQGSQGSSRGNIENRGGGGVPNFATIIAQQLQNLLSTIIAQVGNQVNNQGNNGNQDGNLINDNNQGNVRTMNNGRGGSSYKEFMACNLKDYDGMGGAIVYTRWIEKMELVQDMSGCGENQKVKYTTGSFIIEAGHAAYTNRFHELVRLVLHLVTPENKRIEKYIYGLALQIPAMVAAMEPTKIQNDVLKAGMLTNEAIRNGALNKITEKRGNNREPNRDGKAKDDNKRSRTGRAFSINTNPVRKEYTGTAPKCPNCNYHHQPKVPCHLCTNCNRFRHIAKDYRVGPRPVNPLKARNLTASCGVCFECGGTDHYKAECPRGQGHGNNGNQARGRAFGMGAEEARQDPNIVTGTFTLNNHYATTLFISGADYSFVSTTFIPQLDIEPGMDWLSRHKAEIICHEKVVRIPLPNGKILSVLGERPEEKVRHSKSAKVKEHKLKDIVVVTNFFEVFPDDLSGLPPSQEIKFRINLIPEAMPVAKSPYHLAPYEMEELSSQLRDL
ncbi:putative reverse transcriptase domain-containing protein [Tanacetum coccineum]